MLRNPDAACSVARNEDVGGREHQQYCLRANTAVYLGKVQVNEKTCVGCLLCEEVCGWDGIYIMPSGQKEAFFSSLGYDTSENNAA